jgi:hypothetical protein
MNADGSNRRLLFNSRDYEWGASWSPDGRYIVFTRERGDFDYIYQMNADGTDLQLITERGSYPSWIAEGIINPVDISSAVGGSGGSISATGMPACDLQIGVVAHAAANARLWPEPDVVNTKVEYEISSGTQLVIQASPEWARVRRDVDLSGWWWRVSSIAGSETGWIWQNRLVECEDLPER